MHLAHLRKTASDVFGLTWLICLEILVITLMIIYAISTFLERVCINLYLTRPGSTLLQERLKYTSSQIQLGARSGQILIFHLRKTGSQTTIRWPSIDLRLTLIDDSVSDSSRLTQIDLSLRNKHQWNHQNLGDHQLVRNSRRSVRHSAVYTQYSAVHSFVEFGIVPLPACPPVGEIGFRLVRRGEGAVTSGW